MSFELRKVKDSDFPEVITAMWHTYENPVQSLYRIFCPLNSTGKVDREAAIEESIHRFRTWHTSNPDSYWHKVVDTNAGNKCVGAAQWIINKDNPYKDPPQRFTCDWHPEGGQRDFATQAYWQHNATREELAQRPHLYLGIIFVIPEYQKKGIGRMISEWGFQRAKELNVEIWLDGWKYGKPMYDQLGFTVVRHHFLKPKLGDHEADEAWKNCEKEWTDLEEWVMWRPKDGPYIEGESVKPWEVEPVHKH